MGSVLDLLNAGVELANSGERVAARRAFQSVLELDPYNETATLWLAYLSDSPYQSVDVLEKYVKAHPNSVQAQLYLDQARTRSQELDQLVTGSRTYDIWTRSTRVLPGNTRSVPALGEYMLRQGVISQQQLDMVLRRHQDLARRGTHKQVGQVMIELGYINQNQLDGWLNMQRGDYSDRFRD